MASREQIAETLFDLIDSDVFVTSGRRNTNPEGLTPDLCPAFFLVERDDNWDRAAGFNQLAKKEMWFFAIFYNDVGNDDTKIPSAVINNSLDALDTLLAVDNWQTGTCTLGNLVQAVTIDGRSQRASGDTTGKALAIVPIRVLLP